MDGAKDAVTSPPGAARSYTLDDHDLRLLQRVKDDGPSFMRHASHEFRAYKMSSVGYLTSEMAVYAHHAGRGTAEYRTRYTVTDQGEALLVERPAPPVPAKAKVKVKAKAKPQAERRRAPRRRQT